MEVSYLSARVLKLYCIRYVVGILELGIGLD